MRVKMACERMAASVISRLAHDTPTRLPCLPASPHLNLSLPPPLLWVERGRPGNLGEDELAWAVTAAATCMALLLSSS